MGTDRVSAPRSEGVGMDLPHPWDRDPAHEHLQWYELDKDDDFNDPDAPMHDPLPTARHRQVPD